nr:unnamed protein product [Haemonchus contortus]
MARSAWTVEGNDTKRTLQREFSLLKDLRYNGVWVSKESISLISQCTFISTNTYVKQGTVLTSQQLKLSHKAVL